MSEIVDFKDREAFDESDRELCPDGNCTGLIGSDGSCKVCGLTRDGRATERVAVSADVDEDAASSRSAEGALTIDGDVDDRQLCPDGNCLGLIGSDGKCKVCGRSAAS